MFAQLIIICVALIVATVVKAEPVDLNCHLRMQTATDILPAPGDLPTGGARTVPLSLAIDLEAGTVKVDNEQPDKIISSSQELVVWAGLGQGTRGVVNRITGEAMVEIMTPPQTLYGKCNARR